MDGKTYNSEEEFLKDYYASLFKGVSVTVDIALFSIADDIQNNYRKLNEKKYSVLLIKRDNYPFKDKWCLPGGFVGFDEELEEAPIRVLANETGLHNIYLEQLYTFGSPNRDPRTRVISASYLALVDKNRINEKLSPNASWFNITKIEDDKEIFITLDNGTETLKFTVSKELRESTTDRYKYNIEKNNDLAFDHPLVIVSGMERLKNKASYTDVVFNMMPKYFTLGDLQNVYEVILGKELLAPAFRRIIADKVIKTDKVKTGGGHRPSVLFMYNDKNELL